MPNGAAESKRRGLVELWQQRKNHRPRYPGKGVAVIGTERGKPMALTTDIQRLLERQFSLPVALPKLARRPKTWGRVLMKGGLGFADGGVVGDHGVPGERL